MESLMRNIYLSYFDKNIYTIGNKKGIDRWRVVDSTRYPEVKNLPFWYDMINRSGRYYFIAWFHGFIKNKDILTIQKTINKLQLLAYYNLKNK